LQPRWSLVQLHRRSLAKPEYKRAQLFRWRRQLHGAQRFASLTLEVPTVAAPITAVPMAPGVIEVEFETGARLRICGPVDAPIVAAVMQALTDCGKRDDPGSQGF
jgi:hypothetical protein